MNIAKTIRNINFRRKHAASSDSPSPRLVSAEDVALDATRHSQHLQPQQAQQHFQQGREVLSHQLEMKYTAQTSLEQQARAASQSLPLSTHSQSLQLNNIPPRVVEAKTKSTSMEEATATATATATGTAITTTTTATATASSSVAGPDISTTVTTDKPIHISQEQTVSTLTDRSRSRNVSTRKSNNMKPIVEKSASFTRKYSADTPNNNISKNSSLKVSFRSNSVSSRKKSLYPRSSSSDPKLRTFNSFINKSRESSNKVSNHNNTDHQSAPVPAITTATTTDTHTGSDLGPGVSIFTNRHTSAVHKMKNRALSTFSKRNSVISKEAAETEIDKLASTLGSDKSDHDDSFSLKHAGERQDRNRGKNNDPSLASTDTIQTDSHSGGGFDDSNVHATRKSDPKNVKSGSQPVLSSLTTKRFSELTSKMTSNLSQDKDSESDKKESTSPSPGATSQTKKVGSSVISSVKRILKVPGSVTNPQALGKKLSTPLSDVGPSITTTTSTKNTPRTANIDSSIPVANSFENKVLSPPILSSAPSSVHTEPKEDTSMASEKPPSLSPSPVTDSMGVVSLPGAPTPVTPDFKSHLSSAIASDSTHVVAAGGAVVAAYKVEPTRTSTSHSSVMEQQHTPSVIYSQSDQLNLDEYHLFKNEKNRNRGSTHNIAELSRESLDNVVVPLDLNILSQDLESDNSVHNSPTEKKRSSLLVPLSPAQKKLWNVDEFAKTVADNPHSQNFADDSFAIKKNMFTTADQAMMASSNREQEQEQAQSKDQRYSRIPDRLALQASRVLDKSDDEIFNSSIPVSPRNTNADDKALGGHMSLLSPRTSKTKGRVRMPSLRRSSSANRKSMSPRSPPFAQNDNETRARFTKTIKNAVMKDKHDKQDPEDIIENAFSELTEQELELFISMAAKKLSSRRKPMLIDEKEQVTQEKSKKIRKERKERKSSAKKRIKKKDDSSKRQSKNSVAFESEKSATIAKADSSLEQNESKREKDIEVELLPAPKDSPATKDSTAPKSLNPIEQPSLSSMKQKSRVALGLIKELANIDDWELDDEDDETEKAEVIFKPLLSKMKESLNGMLIDQDDFEAEEMLFARHDTEGSYLDKYADASEDSDQ